jgi:hypothetical protein
LQCDCLSSQTFIAIVRSSSGASADLAESFLEKYVYDSGALFLRLLLTVDPIKIENKPRMISVSVEQICCKRGVIAKKHGIREDIKLRIMEFRDDVIREPTLTVSERKEGYIQQMHTRPGRKGGRRKGGKLTKEQEGMTADQLAELARAEKEKDANRDAVQMSRDMDHPVGV